MDKYQFVDYEDAYPALFTKEKAKIERLLPKEHLIEHIGSTAVPGLGGKGIIDIYIAVARENIEKVSQTLQQKLGYIHKTNAGVEGERVFHEKEEPDENGVLRKYHVHVTYLGNENFRKVIAFRDYLRIHPEDAKRYAEIKQKAVLEATNKNEYLRGKQAIVDELISKALKLTLF